MRTGADLIAATGMLRYPRGVLSAQQSVVSQTLCRATTPWAEKRTGQGFVKEWHIF